MLTISVTGIVVCLFIGALGRDDNAVTLRPFSYGKKYFFLYFKTN